MEKKTIIITGTHLTPALTLIDRLKKDHWQIVYLGRKTSFSGGRRPSVERQLLPGKGIEMIPIISSKLSRYHPFYSLFGLLKIPLGIGQSLYQLLKLQPVGVVSFGGYVTIPVCLAARILKIPLIIHEQTFASGLSNRLIGKFATKVAVSWPQSLPLFPVYKTVLTGPLIRKGLLQLLGKPKPKSIVSQTPVIYITGGNQGSSIINETINQSLTVLLKKYIVFHQFGLAQPESKWRHQQKLSTLLPKDLQSRYHLQRWFSVKQLAKILDQASLVISRAGINTVTELALLRKSAVLIPLPHTQKNEQLNNAKYLRSLGLASILSQENLSKNSLIKHISGQIKSSQQLIEIDKEQLEQIQTSVKATENLYQLICEVTSGSKKN